MYGYLEVTHLLLILLNCTAQMEAVNLEIADQRKLATTDEEKEAVESEHQEILKKLKESEEICGSLRLETEKLTSENKKLNQKLEVAGETELVLNEKLEDVTKERDGLEAELEKKTQEASEYVNQITNLRDETAKKAKHVYRLNLT